MLWLSQAEQINGIYTDVSLALLKAPSLDVQADQVANLELIYTHCRQATLQHWTQPVACR